MTFNIIAVIITLLYLVVLELSKNTIVGWIVAVILCMGIIVGRLELIKHGLSLKRYGVALWAAFQFSEQQAL